MGCLLVGLYILFFPVTIIAALVYLVCCCIFNAQWSFAEVWGVVLLVEFIGSFLFSRGQ